MTIERGLVAALILVVLVTSLFTFRNPVSDYFSGRNHVQVQSQMTGG